MTEQLHLTGRWRRATVVAAGLAVGTVGGVGGVSAMSTIGPSHAGRPAITANPVDPTFDVTLPPVTFVTIPPLTIVTAPPHTFVPTESTNSTETTTTTSETTTTSATTTTSETTTTTDHPPTTLAANGPSQPSADAVFTLVINLAQVNCDGTIRVEYSTTADPAPAGPANHIVMYNPTLSPTAFTVVETADNAPNGAFAFDGAGAPDMTYRVFVIGLFEPADPDGAKAIAQADAALVDGC